LRDEWAADVDSRARPALEIDGKPALALSILNSSGMPQPLPVAAGWEL